jgi:hypothetical protein
MTILRLRFFHAVSVLLLSLLLVSACAPRLEGQAEIHYVGLASGLEIFLPITPDNITEMNSSYARVEVSDPRFQEVMALIDAAGPGSFYAGTTRVRIRDSHGTTVYIDSEGGIRRTFQDRQLDDADLERIAGLLESMTAPRPYTGLPSWAEELAHTHISATRSWTRAEYSLSPGMPGPQAEERLVIVKVAKVSHRDLVTPTFSAYRRVMAAQSHSFELHFDAETRELIENSAFNNPTLPAAPGCGSR